MMTFVNAPLARVVNSKHRLNYILYHPDELIAYYCLYRYNSMYYWSREVYDFIQKWAEDDAEDADRRRKDGKTFSRTKYHYDNLMEELKRKFPNMEIDIKRLKRTVDHKKSLFRKRRRLEKVKEEKEAQEMADIVRELNQCVHEHAAQTQTEPSSKS